MCGDYGLAESVDRNSDVSFGDLPVLAFTLKLSGFLMDNFFAEAYHIAGIRQIQITPDSFHSQWSRMQLRI